MRGFLNLGNTCYFNTAIQCLMHCPPLSNKFILGTYCGDCDFTKEYSQMVRKMWLEKTDTPLHPGKLLGQLSARFSQFRPGEPCDVQEVVLCVIDIFEKSLGLAWVESIFYGEQEQKVAWPAGTSVTKEKIACVILYPDHNEDLGSLIKKYESIQSLEGYKDDSGKTWPIAGTQVKIVRAGKILMITFHGKKKIRLPERFGDYVLFAVAVHHGSQYGGHYSALVKHKEKWYHKDDCTVTEAKFPEAGEFYFCMYK